MCVFVCVQVYNYEFFQVLGTTGLVCLIVSILIVVAFKRADEVPLFARNSAFLCEYGIDMLPATAFVEVGLWVHESVL